MKTEAIITGMDAPLGRAVGNALEVIECIEVMRGHGPADLVEVSMALTRAAARARGRRRRSPADARRRVRDAIDSGAAWSVSAGLSRSRAAIRAWWTTCRGCLMSHGGTS